MTSEPQRGPLFSRADLHPAAVAKLDASALLKQTWLIAFSGGADSLALLLTASALWPEQRSHIIAAHFNHALRAAESDGDERFCAESARRCGVEFIADRWANSAAGASEAEARSARFDFFSKIARERDCAVLLTGHHLDDVIETAFMRMARGASSAGLAAPRPVREWSEQNQDAARDTVRTRWIVRPLLSLSGEQIRAQLKANGSEWREDASNRQADFLRNRIRQNVVPNWLQAAGAGARAGAALTRAWLEEDDAALEVWLDELGIGKVETQLRLPLLEGKPRALLRRALRRWQGAETFSRSGFEALIALVEAGRGQISAGKGTATIVDGCLVWHEGGDGEENPRGSVDVVTPSHVSLPDGAEIGIRRLDQIDDWRERLAAKNIDPRREALIALPRQFASAAFTIRFWQPGDRYAPLGSGGSAKVQDLFGNRKIAPSDRHRLPIIVGPGGQIVWIPHFAPAENCRLSPDSEWGVQLTYLAGTSTVS